jgi:transposase
MHAFHLGIDVAKAKLDCALRLPEGKIRHKVVENTPGGFAMLQTWLARQGAEAVHVCMEATGTYWEAVAEFLAKLPSFTVSVINPAQIKAFGASQMVRTKTDRVDASLIAQFCSERHPAAWQAPSAAEQTLRALVLRLDALQVMRTQESNRLEVARAAVREGIASHLQWLDQEIERLIEAIREHIDQDPTLRDKQRLLDSIPGVGERTIAVLLAFYAQPTRFEHARQAVAFAGMDPRQHESGSSVKAKPHLSKMGHTFLRKALYMPAMVTLYKTAWGKRFRERLASAGKPPMLIIGAMMRKLIHVAFGVLKSQKPFDPALHGA